MTDTHLETREFNEPHGRRTPIDHFFRSLATSGHADPVAIVLSGGGTDGAVGIKDIKEVGGLVMVQQPEDAQYDSMPRAALTTGLVDIILPAPELAKKLAEYVQHRPKLPHDPGQLSVAEVETLQRILAQVHARTGHDFTQYKRSTILRRVERRMQLNGFTTLDAYLAYLRGNAGEAQAMFNDILIGVTNFFRDRDSWAALQQKVIPNLFRQNGNNNSEGIRVWSIGCATGEEAYGIAMLLFEEAAKQEARTHIQIFASDLDDRSIARARDGLYPPAIEADVSPERLERFFMREGGYYRVKRELRDAVLFTNHNVMRDPPFSRQDLIACRNVLIYLQRTVQDRIFDIFHYSLLPGGYLFLGSSESAEHLPELFTIIDKTHRLYKAKPWIGERPQIPSMPLALRRTPHAHDLGPNNRAHISRHIEEPFALEEQHQRALESYGPPSIMVNDRYMILYVSENAGRYLHQPKGPISGDLLTLVRPELQLEIRTALFHAFDKTKSTVSRPVSVQFNGHRRRVIVSVRPRTEDLNLDRVTERQALVLFLEDEVFASDEADLEAEIARTPAERDQMVAQLQSEIQRLREQLQITIEEYDSSNEEMKAANEELQSINEEYRSATEELETSKEELQSVNEELQTVNSEMRSKLEEISRSHQEMENLMGATDIATLYLDRELRIQRYTAGVQELFNILNVDRGRPISDLTHHMAYNQFVEDAEQVLRKLIPVEREIQRVDGNWFLMRLRPYREDRIEGVVITFIDISQLKSTEQQLYAAKNLLEEHVAERTHELAQATEQIRQARDMFFTLFHSNPIPTSLTQLEDGIFLNVNDAYLEFAGLQREKVIGRTAQELDLPIPQDIRPRIVNQLKNEGMVQNLELQVRRASGELATVLASIQLISIDQSQALLLAFIDISDRVKAEQQIRSLAYDLTMAEQEERRRISQILHDDLQQRIFAVKMQISTLYDAYGQGKLQTAQVDFTQLQEWLDESISMTRNLSIDLSPAILQGDGLTDALVWLASQMENQYGLKVILDTNGIVGRYEDTLRILLFQAVREILFNIVKHANTLHANITMERVNRHTRITIDDDGAGFDAQAVMYGSKSAGGLLNLQHRLNLMGCNLQINSRPNGKGTQAVIDVPLDK
jgi:two-component system CheB/CheR fusion protein